MSRRLVAVIACVLLLPTTCSALYVWIEGNTPCSPNSYSEWPGLVSVVNDDSRYGMSWCNGEEWVAYRGDVAALNRVLTRFAAVDATGRTVILLPATVPASKKTPIEPPDWRLHIVDGAVRYFHPRQGIASYSEMEPTLWVYVSDRIPVSAIQVPRDVTLMQAADVRFRYENKILNGNDRARKYFSALLSSLDAKVPNSGTSAEEYQTRLAAIDKFVQRHRAEILTR